MREACLVLVLLALVPGAALAAEPELRVTGGGEHVGKPGTVLPIGFTVTNPSGAERSVTITVVKPAPWTATPDVVSATLAAGESRVVTLSVVGTPGHLVGDVWLFAATASGFSTGAHAKVSLPVAVTALSVDDALLDTPVRGAVAATWYDGSAAAGARIRLAESAHVARVGPLRPDDPPAVPGERALVATVGASGAVEFAFPVSAGTNAPTEHLVRATPADIAGAARTDTYHVFAWLAGP